MDYSRPQRADRLAAEYVAGTLRGPARRRMEALLPAHPRLRDAVQAWQARLMPLTVAVEPVEPPSVVWQRIERQIAGTATAQALPRTSIWQRIALWRGVSAFATVAALAFALLLAMPAPSQPPMVVVLAGTSGEAQGVNAFVAGVSADGRSVVTRPIVSVNVQADRALELWAVPAQGTPRSLGLISEKSASVVQRGRVPPGTAALAVSLEPPQGSPTGSPTGPVLYVGKLTL